MADQTEAFATFKRNITRPTSLQRMFDAGSLKPKKGERRSAGKPTKDENELIRASVIITIGALDAYLSDVAAEVLIAQMRTSTARTDEARALLRRVLREVDTLPLELAILTDQAAREDLIGDALRDHLTSKVSNHGARGVAGTVERMGRKMDWSRLAASVPTALGYQTDPTSPAGLLDAWTDRRHKLVHRGTPLLITSVRARALVKFVAAIVEEVDAQATAAIAEA